MDGLTQMLAHGWPLALAGFVAGALLGGWAARRAMAEEGAPAATAPDAETLAALADEIAAAKELLEAEQAEAGATEETLKALDTAVKRANGRLVILSQALTPPK